VKRKKGGQKKKKKKCETVGLKKKNPVPLQLLAKERRASLGKKKQIFTSGGTQAPLKKKKNLPKRGGKEPEEKKMGLESRICFCQGNSSPKTIRHGKKSRKKGGGQTFGKRRRSIARSLPELKKKDCKKSAKRLTKPQPTPNEEEYRSVEKRKGWE